MQWKKRVNNDKKTDWQANCRNLKERMVHYQNSGLRSDCEFIVGKEKSPIRAHKLIVASASPVFDAMFYGALPETQTNSTTGLTRIEVPDVQPRIFRMLLDYIYKDDLEMTSIGQACDVFAAANKYMLPHVKQKSLSFLMTNIQASNLCDVYDLALLFAEKSLEHHCLAYIRQNTLAMLQCKSIQLSTLHLILDQNELQYRSELELFKTVNRLSVKMDEGKNIISCIFKWI